DRGKNLAGEFELAEAECAALAGRTEPAQEEAEQLPERVEPEAARHDRIALEVAGEEPKVPLEVEHGTHPSLAIPAARFPHPGNAVEHQHGRQRQLGIARAE